MVVRTLREWPTAVYIQHKIIFIIVFEIIFAVNVNKMDWEV